MPRLQSRVGYSKGWSRSVSKESFVSSIVGDEFPRGGDSHMKQTGMLVGNFEFNP